MGEQGKNNASASRFARLPLEGGQNASRDLDPRIVKAGFDLTSYYVETGLKSFADYAQKMIDVYGHEVRPYLKSWYLSVRYYPGVDPEGMDSASVVDDFTISWDRYN